MLEYLICEQCLILRLEMTIYFQRPQVEISVSIP